MEKRRIIGTISACGLAAAMFAGGAFAYLTDTETGENKTITIGKVDVKLTGAEAAETTAMVCNQTATLKPQIANNGGTSAVVFLTVTLPTGSYTPVKEDGTVENPVANGDLFSFIKEDETLTAEKCTENTNWIFLDDLSGAGKYIFGYKMPLAGENTITDILFDQVKLKNFLQEEGAGPVVSANQIQITCEAIQSQYVSDITLDGTEGESTAKTELTNLHKIFTAQKGSSTVPQGT